MKFHLWRITTLLFLTMNLNIHSGVALDGVRRRSGRITLGECVAGELAGSIRSLRSAVNPRDQYVTENLNKTFTTPSQNRRFIQIADTTQAGTNTLFIHNENSVLKKLNDSFQEKNFVTSMNNRYTEILLEKFRILEKENPGVEIYVAQVDPYHDFKTSARAIQWKGKAPRAFQAELDASIHAADKEFTDELLSRHLLRQSDLEVGWYRTGMGDTADRASTAARMARELGPENRVVSYEEPWVQSLLKERLTKTEEARLELENSLAQKIPFVGPPGKATPGEEVCDLIRKSGGKPEVLAESLQNMFFRVITMDQARLLISYAQDVDRFSPSLRIEKREIVNLDDAPHGGLSGDFLGLGSSNLASVASALSESKDLDHALVSTRQAERNVTKAFKEKLKAFHDIIGDIATCSGDDCVAIPKDRPFTEVEKKTLVERLAANPLTHKMRISFIEPGIGIPSERSKIASQGEDIEKAMRKFLLSRTLVQNSRKIIASRLGDFTIAIDMQTDQIFQGKVDMIIGTEPGKSPSEIELKLLRDALTAAVYKVNQKLTNLGTRSRYSSVKKGHDSRSAIFQ